MNRNLSLRYGISTKLILMNMLLMLMFGLIGLIDNFSFRNIEQMVGKIVVDDVNLNLKNAAAVRELSGIFADAGYLLGDYVKNEEILKSKGDLLVGATRRLAAETTDERLQKPLEQFSIQLQAIFDQCGRINLVVRNLDRLEQGLHSSLDGLEQDISDKKVALILKGYDPSIMEQLEFLTEGYQNTLQEISLLYTRSFFERSHSFDQKQVRTILTRLDDFNLRLQTLSASGWDIAIYAQQLTSKVREYRRGMVSLLQAMALLQRQVAHLEDVKRQVMAVTEEMDRRISGTTTGMSRHVTEIIESARRNVSIVSIAVVAVSGILTILFILSTIRKPMSLLTRGINAIRAGNLDTQIMLNRGDEWAVIEEALNLMTAELKASYTQLKKKNDDLEAAQARLQENCEELEEQVDARIEAERELAQQHENLEEQVRERTSALKEAQSELIKREKLAVLGQLTATVSHELRNPLGVIRSSAFYLQQRLGAGDEKIDKHLRRIEKHVEVCDVIVADLLEYTRGRLSEKVRGDINIWLLEVLDQVPPVAGIEIRHMLAPALPLLWFDPEKMRRALLNLVENASHAVSLRMGLDTQEEYKPQILLKTSLGEAGVVIEVEDNGTGMNGETAAHAFEPLFTTRACGTGLGLAIVRKIVEEHGGSVSMVSALDVGTKVTVVVPLWLEPPSFTDESEIIRERSAG